MSSAALPISLINSHVLDGGNCLKSSVPSARMFAVMPVGDDDGTIHSLCALGTEDRV